MKYLLFFLCISMVACTLDAQRSNTHSLDKDRPNNFCDNDLMLYRLRKNPAFRKKEIKMNTDIAAFGARITDQPVYLPVVVHIINTDPASVTDPQVIAGIQLLNDAFSKSGIYAAGAGADTKIRFCLARKDPDGGITTGITRTISYFSDHLNKDNEDIKLKNLIYWDPSRYINIWLVNGIEGESYADYSCGTWDRLKEAGYATMPPEMDSLTGIVVSSFGAVLAHEMGHYFGLYHTFQGGCTNENCLLDGDMVCDTPPDNSVKPSVSCSDPENSCSTDTMSNFSNGFFHTDVPDQIANFMDYGNVACSNEFTQGQANRMMAVIMTQRSSLLQDECTPECTDSIVAGFTRDIPYSITGNTIQFTNTTTGATNFQWLINDIVQSTAINFSYTFTMPSKVKITLRAFNTPSCFSSYTDYIITSCGVTARFYTDKQSIASKAGVYTDSILFTNNSFNSISYQWLISNDKGMAEQVVSTDTNLIYVFPVPANYRVRLVAINGSCSDTTDFYPVMVKDPTANGIPSNVNVQCYQGNKVQVNFCIADYGFAPLPANTPVSFYDADPLLPGAHLLSPSFYLPSAVPGGNCISCFSQVLNVSYHNLGKIYIVFNDSGTTMPLALPNTQLIESNYNDNIASSPTVNTSSTVSVCYGQAYNGHTLSGIYADTLAGVNGCDSVVTLTLTVRPLIQATVDTTICSGESYSGHSVAGTFTDTFTTAKGCDSIRILNLNLNPIPDPELGGKKSICQGSIAVLTPGIFTTYLWQDGSTGNNYNATVSGQYFVLVTNTVGCKAYDTVAVQVNALPSGFLPPDTNVCRGNVVHISITGYSSYSWSTGTNENFIDIIKTGTYSLSVTDSNGCKGTNTIHVLYHDCAPVYIPDAFTPDHNGLNDVFRPAFPSPVNNYHIQIYNRWGNKVFESNKASAGWNGTYQSSLQPPGVFVYILTFKDINGINEKRSGSFVLIR